MHKHSLVGIVSNILRRMRQFYHCLSLCNTPNFNYYNYDKLTTYLSIIYWLAELKKGVVAFLLNDKAS